MGKRKKSLKKVVKKVVAKLSVVFNCPKCSYPKCCKCVIDRKTNSGSIDCTICKATFKMPIGLLTAPIDIYARWIDELEKANKQDDREEDGENNEENSEDESDGY